MNKQEYDSLKIGDKLKIVSLDYTETGCANFQIGEVVEFAGYLKSVNTKNDLKIKQSYGDRWFMSSKDLELVESVSEYKVGDEVVFTAYENYREWERGFGGVVGEKYKIRYIRSKDSIQLENGNGAIFVVGVDQIKKVESDEDSNVTEESVAHPTEDLIGVGFEKTPVKSDGGSSSYYFTKLPQHMIDKIVETGGIEIKDITRYVYDNDSDCKDITKALKRIQEWKKGGGKQGIDALYDANKIIFFAEELRESIKNDFGDKLNIL